MPEITADQLKQLQQDESYMQQAGLSQDDINAYREDRLRGWGIDLGPGQGTPQKEALSALQKAALFTGPAVGGFYGAQLSAGKNALPFLAGAGRALTQFGGEALGIGAGDVAGRFVAGVPQDPRATAETAVGGAGIGSLVRGAVQVGGAIGRLPESVTQAAADPVRANVPLIGDVPVPVPNYQRMTRAGPHTVAEVKAGVSPEVGLVQRAANAARKLKASLTTMRAEKEAIIRQGDRAGVRIPVSPITDALKKHLITDPGEVTSEAGLLNRKINDTIKRLEQSAASSGGTLKPSQVDALIRQQLRPRVYTGSGRPSHTMYAAPIADAEEAATDILSASLPGDLAKKNMQISQELRRRDLAYSLFGDTDKAAVSQRIATAFKPGNENAAQALNTLNEHDPALVEDAFNLFTRRQVAGDIREVPKGGEGGAFNTFVRTPIEAGTRATAPLQRFAGGASGGAYEAFYRAMRPTERPKANP